jgi:hypothetical protein
MPNKEISSSEEHRKEISSPAQHVAGRGRVITEANLQGIGI